MPCGPVANRVPYPLVADELSAGIPYATPVGGATDLIPCALRPRPLLQSVAHPQVGVHSGYSRVPYAFARLAHYSPYLFSEESASYCATHDKRKLSLRIFQINRELTFGQDTYSPYLSSCEGHSQVWQFPLCRYRHGYPRPTRSHSARSNHRAPFFTMLVSPPHVPTFR